jgi:hypothetical protein
MTPGGIYLYINRIIIRVADADPRVEECFTKDFLSIILMTACTSPQGYNGQSRVARMGGYLGFWYVLLAPSFIALFITIRGYRAAQCSSWPLEGHQNKS